MPDPINDKLAHDISSFALTWALMLTLFRKNVITKEEILTSLELAKDPTKNTAAIDELIQIIGSLELKPPN
ncbi:MAG: hypothetical protein ABSF87_04505 [Xanthobacteraceae bacterium]|jgi:hypothetical protein